MQVKWPIQVFRVSGDSMNPTLRNGQRVWVSPYLCIGVGDLIVFNKNAMTMVKRVVEIEEGGYYVEGDNKTASSGSELWGRVKPEQVKGRLFWPNRGQKGLQKKKKRL